jgi:hypothetical protein
MCDTLDETWAGDIRMHENSHEDTSHSNEQERLLKIYCELGVIDRHFGSIQSHYRALASTWLLAAFGAIGFILAKDFNPIIAKDLLIATIGICGAIGIYLLWVLDLLVYQRLLDAAFVEAKKLETRNTWLPQVRNNMTMLLGGKGLSLIVWYYLTGVEVMFLIAGIELLRFIAPKQFRGLLFVEVPTLMGALILFLVHMRRKTSTTPELESRLLPKEEQNQSAGNLQRPPDEVAKQR